MLRLPTPSQVLHRPWQGDAVTGPELGCNFYLIGPSHHHREGDDKVAGFVEALEDQLACGQPWWLSTGTHR